MNIHLTLYEARVIGCLIEKAITTPEQYPLSLNALTNACNQKSSREPVLDLDEATVQQTLDELIKRRLVVGQSGFGSRVTKYQHRFCNSDFGGLQFSPQELGMLCVLLLRGSQTPGELRTRTDRLCRFNDMDEVEATLQHLMKREDGPFVIQFAREAGKRESRYGQIFSGAVQEHAAGVSVAPEHASSDQERLHQLEQLVGELRAEIDQLKQQVEALALR